MRDAAKTKAQLVQELVTLRQRLHVLETATAEHRRVAEALRESEERYRHLVESSQGLICIHDLDGVLLLVNPAAAQALGYQPHEGIGRNLREFLVPAIRHLFDEYLERIRQQPMDSGFMRLMTKAGEERVWMYRNVRCEAAGKPPYVLGHAQDVTELVQARAELRRLAIVLEAVGEGIVITDTTGIIQYVNPAFEHITGYTRAEVMGQNLCRLKSGEPDETLCRTTWETLTRGEVWRGALVNTKKDGTPFDLEATITPVHSASGAIVGYVVVGRDITERKRTEEALRRAERLASIGILATGIAHEINNPVGVMLLAAQSALKLSGESDAGTHLEQSLHTIISHSRRCGQIVKNILRFARQEPTDKWPQDLNAIIRKAVALTRAFANNSRASIELMLTENLPRVNADPLALEQVFVNLIRNAIEAKPLGEQVRVRTEKTASTVRAIVQDNGRGMTAEEQQYLFDPFYTTRRQEGGTGLGLSIVHGIIMEHGGTVTVQSQPDIGTSITIDLPPATTGNEESSDEIPM
jgi:PAS domain S-box-containing protein